MTTGGGSGGSNGNTVYIDVQARLDAFEASLKRLEADSASTGNKAGSALSGGIEKGLSVVKGLAVAAAASMAAAFVGVGAFIADGFQGVIEGQDAVSQLEAVIKSTGNAAGVTSEHLQDVASNIQLLTKFTAENVEATQSMLLTFTNVGAKGGVFDQATKTALDMAQALGGDAAQQALQLGKALNDPIAGISALSRVGVTFSDDQKKVIKSLVETGDTAGAQKIILAELNKEFGGSAEAAGQTFTGQMERAKNALGEVGESIAVRALPLVQQLLDAFIQHMPEIQAAVDKAVNAVSQGFTYLQANVFPVLVSAFNTLRPIAEQLFASLQSGVEQGRSLFAQFAPQISSTFSAAEPILKNFAAGFQSAFNLIGDIYNGVLRPVFGFIADQLGQLVGPATVALAGFSSAFKGAFEFVENLFRTILIPAFNAVLPVVEPILQNLTDKIGVAFGVIGGLFKTVGQVFTGDWSGAWETVKKTVTDAQASIATAFDNFVPRLEAAGKKLGTTILDGLKSALNGLERILLDIVGNALSALANSLPSQLADMVNKAADAAHAAADASAPKLGPPLPPAYGPSQNDTAQNRQPTVQGSSELRAMLGLGGDRTGTPFGQKYFGGEIHNGEDIFAKTGTDVLAPFTGYITTRWSETTGHIIELIDAAGNKLLLGHLDKYADGLEDAIKAAGGKLLVQQGQLIAEVGQTGSLAHADLGPGNAHIHAMGFRAGDYALKDAVSPFDLKYVGFPDPAQQTVIDQPKVGTPANVPSMGGSAAKAKVAPDAEEVRKSVEAEIHDILARVDLKLISKDAAIKLLSAVDSEAQAVAVKQGKGWQEYAATAKTAESAIKTLQGGSTAAKVTRDTLAALATQFEYAGKTGLPAYLKGLDAFIAQQDKAAKSAVAGSKAQLEAEANVNAARKAREQALSPSGTVVASADDLKKYGAQAKEIASLEAALATSTDNAWKLRAQARIAAYNAQGKAAQDVLAVIQSTEATQKEIDTKATERAKLVTANRLEAERDLAAGKLTLAEGTAQLVIDAYDLEIKAAGDSAEAKLAVEQRLGKDVLAARNVISKATTQTEIDQLEIQRNKAVNVEGLGLDQRQKLWAQYSAQIAQKQKDLTLTLKGNAQESTQALAGFQDTVTSKATQAADQLVQVGLAAAKDTVQGQVTVTQGLRKAEEQAAQAKRDAEIQLSKDLHQIAIDNAAAAAKESADTTAGQARDREIQLAGEIQLSQDLHQIAIDNAAAAEKESADTTAGQARDRQAQLAGEIQLAQDLHQIAIDNAAAAAKESADTTAGQARARDIQLAGEIQLSRDLHQIAVDNAAAAEKESADATAAQARDRQTQLYGEIQLSRDLHQIAIDNAAAAAKESADITAGQARDRETQLAGEIQLSRDLHQIAVDNAAAAAKESADITAAQARDRQTQLDAEIQLYRELHQIQIDNAAAAEKESADITAGQARDREIELAAEIQLAKDLHQIAIDNAAAAKKEAEDVAAAEARDRQAQLDGEIQLAEDLNQIRKDRLANLKTLAEAQQRLTDAQAGGAAKYQADIDALEKLRGKPGVVAEELDKLIAKYKELDRQDALEKSINKFGTYAKNAIPGIVAAISGLGGATDEVAGQWGQDLTSMTNDLVNFATSLAKGDYIGAAIQALTSIFTYFSRQAKAFRDELKATNDYDKQFRFDLNGYGTRTVQQYTTGFLFWQSTHFKESIDEAAKSLAQALENGYVSGIENGFTKALEMNDFSLFESTLTETVGRAALNGLITAFLNEGIMKDILGPRIQAVLAASKTPGTADDVQAAIGLKAGATEAAKAAKTFYDLVIKPIGDAFGLTGSGLPKPTSSTTPSQNVTITAQAAPLVATINVDQLATSFLKLDVTADKFVAAGQSNVTSAGLFGAQVDRLSKILTQVETDWAGLRR
ncbi:hypothetical protein DKM44_12800 [Deinococcus irradiatisoli]|uniref:M23ase beta-sheet core domain-containing protein n=1 Tax=Deinococcus irradiatisoli TaxID=2202254 RepID=A0A2Z3JL45_9DEIO|nr:peptidoglycan DD-metalloendopeptidase family protein [Deinococcus irradiatisoli]AWN24000.1 hypothetical protein DKM44_12800 [Deinococcus irradiatisoli]